MDMSRMKDQLVTAALSHAAFDGWSNAALAGAARDLDFDPTLPARLFPGGPAEAVAHLVAFADRAMAADMEAHGVKGRNTGDKVFLAIQLRLERWGSHREAIRRATSLLSLPRNLGLAVRLTWATADAIWRASGDLSHDFSWYTRRATLAAVYSATLLYWLDDGSEGAADTWAFLRRRLAEIGSLPRLGERLAGLVGGVKAPARRWGVPGRSSAPGG